MLEILLSCLAFLNLHKFILFTILRLTDRLFLYLILRWRHSVEHLNNNLIGSSKVWHNTFFSLWYIYNKVSTRKYNMNCVFCIVGIFFLRSLPVLSKFNVLFLSSSYDLDEQRFGGSPFSSSTM